MGLYMLRITGGIIELLTHLFINRSKYESFEAKRKLCGSYDLFLADERILVHLPKLLGERCGYGISLDADYLAKALYPWDQRPCMRLSMSHCGAYPVHRRQVVLQEEEAAHSGKADGKELGCPGRAGPWSDIPVLGRRQHPDHPDSQGELYGRAGVCSVF